MRVTFAILLLSLPLAAQDVDRSKRTDALFAEWAGKPGPGYAVGVVIGGKLVHAGGYGLANVEHGLEITARTPFRLASVSKQFTAACIALLTLRGELALEDDVRKHFPEMPDFGTPVRILHLLHHTSGIPDYIGLHRLAKESIEHERPARSLELIFGLKKLVFAPGERHAYSNSNYLMLGELVRRVSGRNLDTFAREELFGPLGMKKSRFHDDHTKLIPGRADGHRKRRGVWHRSNTTADHVGDGGVFSSIGELSLWERFWTEPERLEGGKTLQELMLTRGELTNGKKIDYALGLVHGRWRGRKTVSHGGSWAGFRTQIFRVPSERLSVICLANFARAKPKEVSREVAAIWSKAAADRKR